MSDKDQKEIRFDVGEVLQIGGISVEVTISQKPNLKVMLLDKKKKILRSMTGKVVVLKKIPFRVRDISKRCMFLEQCGGVK